MLREQKIEKIVSTGGITALPICIAATLLGIPVHLFELNATPGSAIKSLSMFATSVQYCFKSAEGQLPAHKRVFAPYPVRYGKTETALDKKTARSHINLDAEKITIAILGGSQGSEGINPVSYTHLDVYKRQVVYACATYSFAD